MSETVQMIISVIVLMAVYLLTQLIIGYRVSRAARRIIRHLEEESAYDPITAIELPYARQKLLRIGLRDFRPNAVDALLHIKVVSRTQSGKYYLKRRMDRLQVR
jgi:hypothetical protein